MVASGGSLPVRNTALLIACILTAPAAAAFGYRVLSPSEAAPLLAWKDHDIVARGQVIYAQQCAGCHGTNGEGQVASVGHAGPLAPPHDRNGHTWQHPDFALVQLTKAGVSTVACMTLDENAMPKFEKALSDREILDVLSYVKSRWPDDVVAFQERANLINREHNAVMWDLLKLDDGR
jgi:S-disulfanyl-L-cysteine oxidoreductase SoxD